MIIFSTVYVMSECERVERDAAPIEKSFLNFNIAENKKRCLHVIVKLFAPRFRNFLSLSLSLSLSLCLI